jgi:hypothetical protein
VSRHKNSHASKHIHTHTSAGILRVERWAEAHIKIARMTLTIKLDRNWNSFQLANSAPPLSVTDSAIAPSARMFILGVHQALMISKLDLGAIIASSTLQHASLR